MAYGSCLTDMNLFNQKNICSFFQTSRLEIFIS